VRPISTHRAEARNAVELATSLPLGRGIVEPTGIEKENLTIRHVVQLVVMTVNPLIS